MDKGEARQAQGKVGAEAALLVANGVLGFRVLGFGFRVLGFRVWGLGFRV